jgi:hypothetical protein
MGVAVPDALVTNWRGRVQMRLFTGAVLLFALIAGPSSFASAQAPPGLGAQPAPLSTDLGGLVARPCSQSHHPVCGSNGVTYDNRCYFEKAQQRNPRLRIVKSGPCPGAEK